MIIVMLIVVGIFSSIIGAVTTKYVSTRNFKKAIPLIQDEAVQKEFKSIYGKGWDDGFKTGMKKAGRERMSLQEVIDYFN